MLAEFYLADPRVALVPIEHLSPTGLSSEISEVLCERYACDHPAALLSEAFGLYWDRVSTLAQRVRSWAPPRLRNIAIIDSTSKIPPYVQLLNTSTWTIFDCDCVPETSSVELLSYLLAHGDRMSLTGEATLAALHNAAYWFDRDDTEVANFQKGARASTRPDADAYRALADAVPWMRQLGHETLRPPLNPHLFRPIKGTGLLVPSELEKRPPALVVEWTRVAKGAVQRYFAQYRTADGGELSTTLDWLRESPHHHVITGRNNRILWDCEHPDRLGPARNQLRHAGAETLRSIRADLEIIDHHSNDILSRAADGEDLPFPDHGIGQDGYTYLYRDRKILAYNLFEPHLDRLKVPALPFARAMLGARAYHEWCHLAVEAGWVRSTTTPEQLGRLIAQLRDILDEGIAAAPETVQRIAQADLGNLAAEYPAGAPVHWGSSAVPIDGNSPAAALLRMLLPRAADYQANLLASRLQRVDEREAYVRQNIRSLRAEYGPQKVWRMLARYVYELQYLRFSAVPDKRTYFMRSTWFDADFIDSGIISEETLDRIDLAFRDLFDTFEIDETRIHL